MNTPAKKPEARKMRTSYGLHADRLSFSRKPAMRSVKFPLAIKDKNVFESFCEKVKSDYRNCVGNLNLSDWYENEYENQKPTYSVFDFWLDSLRAGFIFGPDPRNLKRFIGTLYNTIPNKDNEFFKIFQEKSPDLCKLITIDFFTLT